MIHLGEQGKRARNWWVTSNQKWIIIYFICFASQTQLYLVGKEATLLHLLIKDAIEKGIEILDSKVLRRAHEQYADKGMRRVKKRQGTVRRTCRQIGSTWRSYMIQRLEVKKRKGTRDRMKKTFQGEKSNVVTPSHSNPYFLAIVCQFYPQIRHSCASQTRFATHFITLPSILFLTLLLLIFQC